MLLFAMPGSDAKCFFRRTIYSTVSRLSLFTLRIASAVSELEKQPTRCFHGVNQIGDDHARS